jgi:hypothetical protein
MIQVESVSLHCGGLKCKKLILTCLSVEVLTDYPTGNLNTVTAYQAGYLSKRDCYMGASGQLATRLATCVIGLTNPASYLSNETC